MSKISIKQFLLKRFQLYSMVLHVTKVNGSLQDFNKEKIIRTCMKMGATRGLAEDIANRIENRAYEGISTKSIIKMIHYL